MRIKDSNFLLRINHRRASVHVNWCAGSLVFVLMQNPNEHFVREVLKEPNSNYNIQGFTSSIG